MKINFLLYSLISCQVLTLSCSTDSDGNNGQIPLTDGVSFMISDASEQIDLMIPDTENIDISSFFKFSTLKRSTFEEQYHDDANGAFSRSPRAFYWRQGNHTEDDSLRYQFNQRIEQDVCIFTYVLPSNNGFPELLEETVITVTDRLLDFNNSTSLAEACPEVDRDDINTRPFDVTVEVLDVSGNTNSQYDKLVHFIIDGDDSKFYYRKSNSITRFAYIEDREFEQDTSSFYEYNSLTGISKYEFNTHYSRDVPWGGGTLNQISQRSILDSNEDISRYAINEIYNSVASTTMVVTRKPSSPSVEAMSYRYVLSPKDVSLNGCYDRDIDINEEDTLFCTSNSLNGVSATNFSSSAIAISNSTVINASEVTTIQFTDATDILTATAAGN
ncbi:hypothetical protein N9N67_06135 [Bacteriovoracaceae bacterium]|nr:hypothetical protein [Bacteriovoracaceae bacterium]